VRPVAGAELSVEELQRFASERLATVAVPSLWWIHEDALPTNDSGKILKHRLRVDFTTTSPRQ
jgi:long-chain acyl-CoA synthetase